MYRYMNAEKYGLDRIYFGGFFIRGRSPAVAVRDRLTESLIKGMRRR